MDGYDVEVNHFARLARAVPLTFRRVPRPLLAPDAHTDFVLVETAGDSGSFSSELLERVPGVRYVAPDAALQSRHALGTSANPLFRRQVHGRGRRGLNVVEAMGADTALWAKGHTGAGVKVAIFDTGLKADHPHFRHVRDRTDWTNEHTRNDGVGHGTFVAGIIAGTDAKCPGLAPDAELYIYRVFTTKEVSFTSWFLDAFNHALAVGVDILNLSIGGADFMDQPFVDKVHELVANGIIVVSAIGNDGPLYGTLNNPADQPDVIGVGGLDRTDAVAAFSSRGMTTWELPAGYGRVKPDVMTVAKDLAGSNVHGGCRTLSGTSVASPVVAGAIALLLSAVPRERVSPASVKQALVHSGARVGGGANIFEQGAGKVHLDAARDFLATYEPHATAIPSRLDLTDCPFMWPYCSQPLYHSSMPVIVNVTILNGLGVQGVIEELEWLADDNDEGSRGLLDVTFSHAEDLWPWSGHLGVHLNVTRDVPSSQLVVGRIRFTVVSADARSVVEIPLRAMVAPTPPRNRRLLWDQFHNLRYPAGYFPRDNLDIKSDILDWNGDHIHTNYRELYEYLRSRGYFIEVLGTDFTCVDASRYGALLIVDPEEEYFLAEIQKLERDVREHGLSVVVLGEWFNAELMRKIKFFDDNTDRWWTPVTGGANLPALNDLLAPFGMAFGNAVFKGQIALGSHRASFASGTSIARFPAGGFLFSASLRELSRPSYHGLTNAAILGLWEGPQPVAGRIALYGDSNCVDMNHRPGKPCHWLMDAIIRYAVDGVVDSNVFPQVASRSEPFRAAAHIELPQRVDRAALAFYSKVSGPGKRAQCVPDALRDNSDGNNDLLPDTTEEALPTNNVLLDAARKQQQHKSQLAVYGLFAGMVAVVGIVGALWASRRDRKDTAMEPPSHQMADVAVFTKASVMAN